MNRLITRASVVLCCWLALGAPARAEGFSASAAIKYALAGGFALEGYAAYTLKVTDNLEVTGRVDASSAPGLNFTVYGQYGQNVFKDGGLSVAAYGRAAVRYFVLAPDNLGLVVGTGGAFVQYESADVNVYGNLELSALYFLGRAFTLGVGGNVYVAPKAIFPVLVYAGTDNILGARFNSYVGVTLPLSTTFFLKLQGGFENNAGAAEGFYVRLAANLNSLF